MEHFIAVVRKYPCLWNTAAIEYRDQELKDAAWAEVMKETDLSSVKEVKLKWKKLRDSYRDALKRQSDMLAKEPGNPARKTYPWKYMGPMQFLQPHMNNRKRPPEGSLAGAGPRPHADRANGHDGIDARSTDDTDSDPDPEPRRKSERLALIDRKLDYLCKAQSERACGDGREAEGASGGPSTPGPRRRVPSAADPLDIFFTGMCQSTKRLPYSTQIGIKKTLFNAVIEAEEALVAEQQKYASLWAQEAGSSSSSEGGDEEDRKPT